MPNSTRPKISATASFQVKHTNLLGMVKHAAWIGPWILGSVIIGALGQYGEGARLVIPGWWDLVTVAVFSLVIYYWAVHLTMPKAKVLEEIAKDSAQIDFFLPPETVPA